MTMIQDSSTSTGRPVIAGTPEAIPAIDARSADARSADAGSAAPRPGRDRYIDSLRALALVRVVTYHLFGWAWLTVVFPSMGIMFALAGSLVAASLDREQRHYGHVLLKRLRRLLPPFWAFGLVMVPLMLVYGWSVQTDSATPLTWSSALLWLVPFATPPASSWGVEMVVPLWYISTYLWLMLLSPALLWLFRRWPTRMMALPLIFVAMTAAGLIEMEGAGGDMVLYVATYLACWLLGFAHHDGMLRRLPLSKVAAAAVVLAGLGIWYAVSHPDPDSGVNLSDIPLATALFSVGVVLLLLRLYLDFSWMAKVPVLDGLVAAINRRAMTIYLWGNTAIALALYLLDAIPMTQQFTDDQTPEPVKAGLVIFAAVWLVVGAFVLLFGWVEDVAARRRPQLLPRRPRRSRAASAAGVAGSSAAGAAVSSAAGAAVSSAAGAAVSSAAGVAAGSAAESGAAAAAPSPAAAAGADDVAYRAPRERDSERA